MNKSPLAIFNEWNLAESASAQVAATVTVAGDHGGEVRKRLATGLDRVRHIYAVVRGKVVDDSHGAAVAMRDNIYQVVGIGIMAGALVGFLLIIRRQYRHESFPSIR